MSELGQASAPALDPDTGNETESSVVLHVAIAILRWLPGSLYWLITFVTITLPSWMFTIFSTTLTISLNATTVYVLRTVNPHDGSDSC